MTEEQPTLSTRLPAPFVMGVLLTSLIPAFLVMYGSSAGLIGPFFESMESLKMSVGGSGKGFHAPIPILEWMTLAIALVTAGMGIIHLWVDEDMSPLIVGVTAIAASSLDAGHALMATTLTGLESNFLVQMTWGISRAFTFILIILGYRVALDFTRKKPDHALVIVATLGLSMLAISGGVLKFCAQKIHLTRTVEHTAHLARVWNLLPFFLMGFAYLTVIRPLDLRCNNRFSHTLLLSLVPQAVAQIHLASSLYSMSSIHYYSANFLELFAFTLPLIGIGFTFVNEFTLSSGKVTNGLRNEVKKLTAELYAERSEMDTVRLKIQRERAIRQESLQEASKLLNFYHTHPRVEIIERTARSHHDPSGIREASDGTEALELSQLEAVLPKDIVNILKYCLQKAQQFLKERQHEIDQARRVLGFQETTQARTEGSNKKLWAFYQNHPQPAVEFAVDGTAASYNDAAFQLMRKLGKGSLTKLSPTNMIQIVRSCLKDREHVDSVEVVVEERTLVWAFFPDPDSKVVFGYLVRGFERLSVSGPTVGSPD